MSVWIWSLLSVVIIVYVVCTIIFIAEIWRKWYPALKQKLSPAIGRALFVTLNALAGILAHISARHYLNTLTGVDPNNFPTTLLTFTALAGLSSWIALIGIGAFIFGVVYMVGMVVLNVWEQFRILFSFKSLSVAQEPVVSIRRRIVHLFGAIGIGCGCLLLLSITRQPPFTRIVNLAASIVLVGSEFSYDQTCPVSSEKRLVAHLKDRKELKASRVLIADLLPRDDLNIFELLSEGAIGFSVGTCE
jgi:hypothetical protein